MRGTKRADLSGPTVHPYTVAIIHWLAAHARLPAQTVLKTTCMQELGH